MLGVIFAPIIFNAMFCGLALCILIGIILLTRQAASDKDPAKGFILLAAVITVGMFLMVTLVDVQVESILGGGACLGVF